MFMLHNKQPGKRGAVGCEQQRLNGTIEVRVISCHFVTSSDFQRCMAAYERQGRHASAFSKMRFGFFSLSAFIIPKSVWGNASGQPNARMAMYCAVHSPMPGSAFNCSRVWSTLA